ncbi:hypothetical protein HMPREF2534_02193 [Bacteroides thetaiotaomicron]|nr:hypothetical protein HMPREF2534_02193 [Bacteroides thetaiotaomicron]
MYSVAEYVASFRIKHNRIAKTNDRRINCKLKQLTLLSPQ